MNTPVNPSFTIQKWGVRRCSFHAHVSMMVRIAVMFGDHETAEEIMTTNSPRNQKALGRQVRNFKEAEWTCKRKQIVRQGNLLKV